LDAARLRAAAEKVEAELRKAGDSAAAEQASAIRKQLDQVLDRDVTKQSLGYLAGPSVPKIDERRSDDAQIQDVLKQIRARQTEAQTAETVAKIDMARIEQAIALSLENAEAFDKACQPVTDTANELDALLSKLRQLGASPRGLSNDVAKPALASLRAARQDFTVRRYAREAKFNQEAAELFELQVRRSGADADRHRIRSKNFFYAMLCAQAGVTVASLALARSRMSLFWLIAAIAGFLAVGFGAYVYIAM
jgi:hypothetical protein